MASTLVRRDQFKITPQGIVHKPINATFTPHPGDLFQERRASVGSGIYFQLKRTTGAMK
jgi:hypothetical protein